MQQSTYDTLFFPSWHKSAPFAAGCLFSLDPSTTVSEGKKTGGGGYIGLKQQDQHLGESHGTQSLSQSWQFCKYNACMQSQQFTAWVQVADELLINTDLSGKKKM